MMTFLCTRSGRRARGVECRIATERAYFRACGLPDANMFGWWPRLFPVMPLALLWVCLAGANSDCKSVAIETDGRIAAQAQQRHLQALFVKYGQNGSISLEGLYNLLKGVGLDRIRKVMVHHPGNAHNHTHSHDHSHTHVDKLTAHTHPVTTKKGDLDHNVEKSDPVPKAQPDPASGKKTQSDAHHNLYMKMNQESTTPLTTPSYVTKSRRTNRSADYDLTQDHASFSPTQPNMTHSNHTHHDEDTPTHQHDEHDEHEHGHASQGCQNASTILQTHGMRKEMSLSVKDFSFLCPALLMQIDSKSCIVHEDEDEHSDHSHHHKHHHHHHDHQHLQHPHNHTNGRGQRETPVYIAWIGGFLSITLISLLALVGVVLIPLMNRVCFNFLLSFLVALAVGTLSGDALLHLIPHSQGHHHHGHSEQHAEEEEDSLRPVWTGLTALSGVYIMFLIEHFLTLGKMYKDKNQKVQKRVDLTTEVLESEKLPSLEENDVKIEAAETNGGHALAEEEEVMLGAELYNDVDCENKCHSHFHDTVGQSDEQHHHHHDYHHILHHHHSQNHHPHTHTHRHTHSYSQQHFEQAGVATLAWMVIMGDGLHNFSDGLAIGAAFTEGLSSGLSTSVAVFCHELPHELGDFAVLLKAGMSVRQAMLYNLLSALMGYLGMITGILIGHYAENIATWIFALTAGLFMYVALVDMVPEMLHNDASEAGFSHYGFFLLQNAGILLGFGIMLVIAVFEDRIQLDLGY
ncbi:LOW QUALITY PROTEIN: zinc transporter ZIP6 [Danio aesculapii]|uniref:LOW QUALITY PROTEIN: zinc transporter ZIP6 n=1 Tax=Danio aesculapii TaxID=1142201 RepID=UPI0024C067DF|nr:LOW QUALITY PROTEIN: zinc transporter ZIP6 [Danio aesculapii]